MIKTLIAAHDPNLVIGKDGGLPWHYPEDLKHFKKHTSGQIIIMGRGVFEELNEKPLPNRRNIVLSRSKTYKNVETYTSLEEALSNVEADEVFIIGGGVLYTETLLSADRLLITEIKTAFEGDTFFPEYRDKIGEIWEMKSEDDHEEFRFIEYSRI
jgi:dihydrofolate reductase